MLIKELANYRLDEIGFASNIQMPNFSSVDISKLSPIGYIDNEDVFVINEPTYDVYFFKQNNQISCYVALGSQIINGYKDLIRVHKINNAPKGAITTLIMFFRKNGIKIRISDTEPLTHQGINWLIKLIQNPRGLKITNQSGNAIDVKSLHNEWVNAFNTNIDGPTSIYIEGKIVKHDLLEKWDGKGVLRPSFRYLHDEFND